MKKVLYTLAALSFVFVACNKQEIVPEEGTSQEGELTTVTIKASNGDADTKAAIANDLAFTWTTGDQIAVYTNTGKYVSDGLASGGSKSAEFTVTLSGTREGFAVYPASVAKSWNRSSLTLTLPSEYDLTKVSGTAGTESPLPMIAANISEALSFYHVTGLFRVTVKAIPSDATGLVFQFPGNKVNGDFTISSPTAGTSTITTSAPDGDEDKITVTFEAGTATEMTLNIPLPTGTYDDVFITPIGTTKVAAVRHIDAGGYTAARAHGKKLTATLVSFTINDSGDKVVFAPGNLQYQASTGTWRFAGNQYSYIGRAAGNMTIASERETQSDWIDLFGWGTSGWNKTTDSYWTRYQPWCSDESMVSEGSSEYYTNRFHYGPTYDSEGSDNNLTGNNANGDWGVFNIIDHFAKNTWRTPTGGDSGEWMYLITKRAAYPIVSYAMGKIESTPGLFVFPDNYVHPIATSISNYNDLEAAFTSNQFSSSDWVSMESAGAVFLPAAGYRDVKKDTNDTPDVYAGDRAYYWSSTGRSGATVYFMYFTNNLVQPNGFTSRKFGGPVRLVRDL